MPEQVLGEPRPGTRRERGRRGRRCSRSRRGPPEPPPDLLPVAPGTDVGVERAELDAALSLDRTGQPGSRADPVVFVVRGRHDSIKHRRCAEEAVSGKFADVRFARDYAVSASAPPTTSRISCVISACRARFISSVRLSISSAAFFDAFASPSSARPAPRPPTREERDRARSRRRPEAAVRESARARARR